jgi:hypothetical protein
MEGAVGSDLLPRPITDGQSRKYRSPAQSRTASSRRSTLHDLKAFLDLNKRRLFPTELSVHRNFRDCFPQISKLVERKRSTMTLRRFFVG